jgi:hypothetical protein
MLKMRLGEERGVRIQFHHEHDPGKPFITGDSEGNHRLVSGITLCKIFEEFGGECEMEYIGWAECSTKDRYSKEVGRKVSLKRALRKGEFEYEDRKAIWKAYFQRKEEGNGTAVNTGTV